MLLTWPGERRSPKGCRDADAPGAHGDNGATLKATTVLACCIGSASSHPIRAHGCAMTRPAPRRCSAPRSIGRSSRSRDLLIWTLADNGRCGSYSGTTTNTATAASATSPGTATCRAGWPYARPPAVQSTRTHGNAARNAGVGRPWKPVGAVTLNPERDTVVRAATSQIQLSGSTGEPAFPSRPGSAQAAARNAGDGRSRATRSRAERSGARAWRGWRAPDLLRSEDRGTLITSRRFGSPVGGSAPPDICTASAAASSIGGIIT
jgi:hypothetical protein